MRHICWNESLCIFWVSPHTSQFNIEFVEDRQIEPGLEKTCLEDHSPESDSKLLMLKTELLKRIDLFNPLPSDTIQEIVKHSRDIYLKEDDILFDEGISENIMYIIMSGRILITKGGKRITVLGQGEYLGEMPLIDFKARSASAKALDNVLLMEIPADLFKKYISINTNALFEMMKVFSSRIRSDLDSMSSDMQQMSNFTHDMRNCLVPLEITEILLNEVLNTLRGTAEHHKTREGWDKVKRGVDKMIEVKNNLIVLIDQCLACVKQAKMEHVKDEFDIVSLIHETVEEVSCHKNLKGKEVRIHVDGVIPMGYFNFLDIKRVLQNLIINAGYVTKKSGEIDINVKDLNNMSQISVKDYGCGIKDEIKPILLKEIFTSKADGNGIGLMSCRQIIEKNHKGKIWFESDWGKGTTFHFTLPHPN